MTTLIYDNTWIGFLTSIFEVYERKIENASIVKETVYQPQVFAENIQVSSDKAKAERVWKGLQKKLPYSSCRDIYCCYLSEIPGIENTMLQFIRLAFSMEDAEKAFGNAAVLKVSQTARMVHREKHRMEAFVRFKLTTDGIYFAEIDPDFNVLPLIAKHFKNRYADQKWLIYDLKRKYGIFYNLVDVEEITLDFSVTTNEDSNTSVFSEDEALYQTLWKDYFEHVNISERKNTKLHLRHVPKRYWKYLIEKQG